MVDCILDTSHKVNIWNFTLQPVKRFIINGQQINLWSKYRKALFSSIYFKVTLDKMFFAFSKKFLCPWLNFKILDVFSELVSGKLILKFQAEKRVSLPPLTIASKVLPPLKSKFLLARVSWFRVLVRGSR